MVYTFLSYNKEVVEKGGGSKEEKLESSHEKGAVRGQLQNQKSCAKCITKNPQMHAFQKAEIQSTISQMSGHAVSGKALTLPTVMANRLQVLGM